MVHIFIYTHVHIHMYNLIIFFEFAKRKKNNICIKLKKFNIKLKKFMIKAIFRLYLFTKSIKSILILLNSIELKL